MLVFIHDDALQIYKRDDNERETLGASLLLLLLYTTGIVSVSTSSVIL